MEILMTGSTRYHNWFDKQRTIPRRMLAQAQEAGLIGLVEWLSVGSDDEQKEVEQREDSLERLLDHQPKRGELYRIAAGGSTPPWHITLGLFPFRRELEQVEGYNILNVWFEQARFSGSEGSDSLVQAFRSIYTPETTEFAFIHPYERWSELSNPLNGPYGTPVTIGPMFSGVYWAIFLGWGHLVLFDLAKLQDLHSYQVEWTNDQGLFVRVSQDISDSTSPAVEAEMFRLTEIFRAALR